MRCREEDAAGVREQELLRPEVGDAEHQHVVESLARVSVDRVAAALAMGAEELAVHEVGGTALVAHLPGRVRHRKRELVEVGHRRHGFTLPVRGTGAT